MSLLEQQQRSLVAEEAATGALAVREAIAQLKLSASAHTAPASPPPGLPASSSSDVAVSVLTNPPLLWNIGSFQQDPLAFMTEYKTKVLGTKASSYSGSLVDVAISRKDLHALKMMYTARPLHPETAERPELSFREDVMDAAVCECQKEITRWLHARSQQHRVQIESTPRALTLLQFLQVGRMEVVRWLFDLHDDRINERFMDVLKDTLRQSPHSVEQPSARARGARGDRTTRQTNAKKRQQPGPYSSWYDEERGLLLLQCFVEQRPALHATLLTVATEVGSRLDVGYLLNPRSGVDTTTMAMLPAMIVAARGGYHDLVELLFAAKRPKEVIDIAVLRKQLSRVDDAGALQLLLSMVAARDPAVQKQLEAEWRDASALFGLVFSSERKTAARAKAGRRF